MVLAYKPDKLDPRATGPYRIEQEHVNGTVTIRRSAHITERINISRVRPSDAEVFILFHLVQGFLRLFDHCIFP